MESKIVFPAPIRVEKPWGYEDWILSGLDQNPSVADGKRLFKSDFPLLAKIIQANGDLSLQIHPDDTFAQNAEGQQNGKTECWLVLWAKSDASLICGLDFDPKDASQAELEKMIESRQIESRVLRQKVSAGDFIFIPAGTAHAILGGTRLLEIQQPSDLTYRMSDWGRGREVHVEKSAKMLLSQAEEPKTVKNFLGGFSCPAFSLEVLEVEGKMALDGEEFFCAFCIDGKIRINGQDLPKERICFFAGRAEVAGKGRICAAGLGKKD